MVRGKPNAGALSIRKRSRAQTKKSKPNSKGGGAGKPKTRSQTAMDDFFNASLPIEEEASDDGFEDTDSNGGQDYEEVDQLEPSDDDIADDTFPIPIEVPYHNAVRDVDGVMSDTPFDDVLRRISKGMGVSIAHLADIGYIPSFLPKTPKPRAKLLEDEESWVKLVDHVCRFRSDSQAKKRGKGTIPPFVITIVDTGDVAGPASGKGKKKALSKKDMNSGEDSLALNMSNRAILAALKEIELKYHCEKHSRACLLIKDDCYQLTNEDLTIWSRLLASHHATIDTPPDALDLPGKVKTQAAVKLHAQGANHKGPFSGSESAEQWVTQLVGVGMAMQQAQTAQLLNALQLNPRDPGYPPHSFQAQPLATDDHQSSQVSNSSTPAPESLKHYTSHVVPSLTLGDWLPSLDSDGERGKNNDHFAQYITPFSEESINKVADLVGFDVSTLKSAFGMPLGRASRLLKYAKEDIGPPMKRLRSI